MLLLLLQLIIDQNPIRTALSTDVFSFDAPSDSQREAGQESKSHGTRFTEEGNEGQRHKVSHLRTRSLVVTDQDSSPADKLYTLVL